MSPRVERGRGRLPRLRDAGLAAAWLAAACATPSAPPPIASAPPVAATGAVVLGRTPHVLVVRAAAGDTAAEIAKRFLNDPDLAWRVTVLDGGPLREGAVLALSLDPADPGLAPAARYVPVLCYHRFTTGRSGSLMEVGAESFDAQLRWLRDNGYTVVPLARVAEFVNGHVALGPKTVAITIDDGYRSALSVALPVLKRYGDPATLFVYTDFVGSRDALSWADLADLGREPLISVQSHSKTHRDMVKRLPGETAAAFAQRRQLEAGGSLAAFAKRSSYRPDVFAYPYGSADLDTVTAMKREGYRAAFTVARGGNAAWGSPYLLRRDMIYGSDDLAVFVRRLQAAERGAVAGPKETEG